MDERATLVTSNSQQQSYSTVQLTDARTAAAWALRDYLQGLVIDVAGRRVTLQKLYPTWADPEADAQYPSAVIYANEPGKYDASRFSPTVESPSQRIPNTNLYLYSTCEYVVDFTLEIRCTDAPERRYMVMALEQALSPVLYMYGFKMELPYYFGQRVVFEPMSMRYVDDEQSALQKFRLAQFLITAQVPVTRVVELPLAKIRTVVEVTAS